MDDARFEKLWADKVPIDAIASEWGVTPESVSRRAKRMGLQSRYGGGRVQYRARIKELETALGWFLDDERFRVAVGGNPHAVEKMLSEAREIYERK